MHVNDKPARPRRAVASSETAREINRDILLHAIHLHQPVSRADLARLTGLQPSTVSVIIGQLIDEGWVVPGSWAGCRAGRRPTFVTLNDRHVTLAIDLRPGKANLAVVDINGKILGRETVAFDIKAGSTPEEARRPSPTSRGGATLRAALRDRVFQGWV
jgi:predicted ArsR family transcriptional regulator